MSRPLGPGSTATTYDAVVPDTLDLAERAKLGLRHFLSIIDEAHGYEMPLTIDFDYSKPSIRFHMNSLGGCQAKALEAMCYERLMTGSCEDLEKEAKMIDMMLSLLGEDGLMWVPGGPDKPWIDIREPFAYVHGQGRMLRAMIAWYQYTDDPVWKDHIARLVEGLDKKMVVHKGDYAYFPVYGWHEGEYTRSCYTRRGWKDTVEPPTEKFGEEGSLFNHQGHVAGALANWYRLAGDEDAFRLSGELVRFLSKPQFWADYPAGDYPGVAGAEHAHWQGHFHGHINTLRAILEYAVAANDSRLKQFVRDGYEWARQAQLARIGIVGDWQGCGIGRLIGLAVKLTDAGVGDYWEDVDLYVRNMGTEMQVIPEDVKYLREVCNGKPQPPDDISCVSGDDIAERSVGGYFGFRNTPGVWLCCSPHGNMGLFYAWDGTIRGDGRTARINLLLNRASPWMDVDSYLPYEGKVVLRNKTAGEVLVRIPLYVQTKTVRARVGRRTVTPKWFGRYLRVEDLKPRDVVTIQFLVNETTESWKCPGPYQLQLRANTVVEMDPSPGTMTEVAGHVLYQHQPDYRSGKAPMKSVTRYVSPIDVKW